MQHWPKPFPMVWPAAMTTTPGHDIEPQNRPTRYAAGKHDRRRAEIVALASQQLNQTGLGGLVMADIAAQAGMTKANLTYYFKRKEDLAILCFNTAIDAYQGMIAAAARQPSASRRIEDLILRYFARATRAIRGEDTPLAILSDIRALGEPHHSRAIDHYSAMLHATGALLQAEPGSSANLLRAIPHAQMVLVQLFWSAAWIDGYAPDDHPRVAKRLNDIVTNGLALPGRPWLPEQIAGAAKLADRQYSERGRLDFYRATIRLINLFGYRGTSIDRIAAAMGVTKGAIYHHHESKDDLVLECFDYSFAQMWGIIRAAEGVNSSAADRVFSIVAALVAYQASPQGPFLRDTALTSLPMDLRMAVLTQWNRIILHLGSLVADGIAAGELRPVDPHLAAHAIVAGINAAEEINRFMPANLPCNITLLCIRPLLSGVLFGHSDPQTLPETSWHG